MSDPVERSPSLQTDSLSAGEEECTCLPFMEPEHSLSCSQDSTNEPYPDIVEFSPHRYNIYFDSVFSFRISDLMGRSPFVRAYGLPAW